MKLAERSDLTPGSHLLLSILPSRSVMSYSTFPPLVLADLAIALTEMVLHLW